MSPKLETLWQLTQSLQSLVADLTYPDQEYIGAEQSLKEISGSLQASRLTLQIVGQDIAQAEKLQKMLEIHSLKIHSLKTQSLKIQSGWEANYQFKAAAVPPIPTLILRSSLASTVLTQYKLETLHNQVIGRNPATAQLVLPNSFHLTSSNHAEFRLFNHNWQIRDAGSSNGTFVNDNSDRLQDWQTLKAGDRICLGSPFQAEGSANFVVDIPTSSEAHFGTNITQILNCNIICLVVPLQPLPESFQYLLKTAKTSEVSKYFIVIDRSESIDPDDFATIINQIDNSVKYQLSGVPYGIFPLLFNDHVADGVEISSPQPELENFYNSLENLSVLGTETILTKWAVNKLSKIIDETEDILLTTRNITDKKLSNSSASTQNSFHSDPKKSFEKIIKRVISESDDFFRQIKIEVNQSKSNFLDEFKQNSIGQKIQEFTKILQPQLITKGEYRNVYLQTEPGATYNNVHEALVDLCHAEISQWVTGEWERVKNEYAGGGLSFFLEDSFNKLSFMPEVSISKKDFASSQKLNTQTILNTSSVEPDLNTKYRKISFFEYLLKNGKSHVFGSVTLTLIVTFLFKGAEQPGANGVKSDIEIKIFYLILFLVPFTISVLWFNYKQDRDIRLKEATDKLKKESNAYYRSYTEWLVEKLIQRIDIIMSAEERHFHETLGNVQEIYESYFTTQSQTDSQQDCEIEQTKIIEYLNRLHHLKKLIQN
jgi:FHA domain